MKHTTLPAQQTHESLASLPAYLAHQGDSSFLNRTHAGRSSAKKTARKTRRPHDQLDTATHYFGDSFFAHDQNTDDCEEFIHTLSHRDLGGDAADETLETARDVEYSAKKKDSLDAYLSSLEKYRPLSKTEEQAAALAHAAARRELINHLSKCPEVVQHILKMCAVNATSDTLKQITHCRKALQVVNDARSVGAVDAGSQPAHAAAFDGNDFSKALANLKRALNNLRIKSAVLISAVKSLGTPHQGQLRLECDATHVPGAEPAYLAQPTGPTTLAGRKAAMSTKELAHFAEAARKLEAQWITARNKLIEPNLRFVVHQVKNLACPGMPLADLIAEGNQALIEAADSFDPSKKIKFCSYAGTFLQRQVTRAVDDKARLIRMPVHACAATRKIYAVNRRLEKESPLKPTDFEIAAETGIAVERVRELRKASMPPESIHQKTSDEGEQTLEDFLPDPQDWKEQIYGPDEVTTETLRMMLSPLMPLLSECQQLVITSVHGLNGAARLTEEESALSLRMTISQVRAHHSGALTVIKNHFAALRVVAA